MRGKKIGADYAVLTTMSRGRDFGYYWESETHQSLTGLFHTKAQAIANAPKGYTLFDQAGELI